MNGSGSSLGDSLEMKSLLYILCLALLPWTLAAQVSKEGSPLSWNAGLVNNLSLQSEVLPPLNIPQLLQEDNATIGLKTHPYRFAQKVNVEYSTAHNGEWRNLPNGDRIWLLSIRCENALALSLEFSHLMIPQGATVYLYNGDRSDFAGPFTQRQSRINLPLGTAPIGGNHLILEYYEPFSRRGQGELVISSVARSYRDTNLLPVFPGNDCVLPWSTSSTNQSVLSDAVLLIVTDHGQRVVTGTLVNNTRHDGVPYVLTAIQGLIGDPGSMVFVQGVKSGCNTGEVCWDKFVSGAEIIYQNGQSGIVLLKLLENPRRNWNSYVAGWSLRDPGLEWYSCIQHAYGSPMSVARFLGRPEESSWNNFSTLRINEWSMGNTFSGSLGSPLFNARGELVGILTGGLNTCSGTQGDHFGSLAQAWEYLQPHLDPLSENANTLAGFYPLFEASERSTGEPVDLVIFPNPAVDRLYIQNNSREPVMEAVLRDPFGRICRVWNPNLPYLELDELSSGAYLLTIQQNTQTTHHRVVIR